MMGWKANFLPLPLEGLGREADQGWGEGFVHPLALDVRTPPPAPSLKGRGREKRGASL